MRLCWDLAALSLATCWPLMSVMQRWQLGSSITQVAFSTRPDAQVVLFDLRREIQTRLWSHSIGRFGLKESEKRDPWKGICQCYLVTPWMTGPIVLEKINNKKQQVTSCVFCFLGFFSQGRLTATWPCRLCRLHLHGSIQRWWMPRNYSI